ncbi:MAG: ADOP family duplicated permease [Vicinamibacterales bacterium]
MNAPRPPVPVRLYARAARLLGDLSDEAAAAFADLYDEHRARGRRAAAGVCLRAGVDLVRAVARIHRPRPLRALGQDLRWALRRVRRRPAVSVVIVASMGLAIGANTAAFSVVNAFLLRSWSTDGVDRVVRLREDHARPGDPPDVRGFTLANLGSWRRANTVLDAIAAGTGTSATLTLDGRPERVAAGVVTANFFDVIGIRPAIGRTFTAEEDSPARRDAVILGDALWRTRFGADPGVLGRSIDLNGRARVVVGVMPRGFRHPYQSDLWVPLGYREDAADTTGVYAPARLKPGVSLAQANTELDAMARRLHDANPAPTTPFGAQATWLRPEMLGRLPGVLYALGAAALLVLLIATANVTNLLLAQGLDQQTETAVRAALGATRGRLLRQHVTYSLLVSGLGAVAGLLLTFWSVRPLVGLSPLYGAGEFDIEPRLDWPTLGVTAGLALVVGLVVGVVPSLRASRAGTSDVLRASGRSGTLSAGSRRWLRGLVVAELALAFVLLAGAAVMGQGLLAMARDTWGLDRHHALTFDVAFSNARYPDRDRRAAFLADLVARLDRLPGASAAAATTTAPFFAGTEAAVFNVDGVEPPARGGFLSHSRTVTPGYFAAAGIPIVAGRDFDDRDRTDAAPVVVVSQSFADRYWPGRSPIGRRVRRGAADGPWPWMEVIGVVGSIRENGDLDIPAGDAWYLPYRQATSGPLDQVTVVVRTTGSPLDLLPAARAAVSALDAQLPISDTVTLDDRFARYTATERLTTTLTGALGAVGLFLAAIGVYGVLAFSLSRRLPELGIRAALGAAPSAVRALILREALGLAIAGLGAGALLAVGVVPRLDADLFPTGTSTALALVRAMAGTAMTALVSSLIPAARAARVPPIGAMRGGA